MSPHLTAIATAIPEHVIDQDTVLALSRRLFGAALDRLGPIHLNSGIEKRHSCVPAEWYASPHGWRERMALFTANAVELGARAAGNCLEKAALPPERVDAVVAVSTTGICTPSLDALLMERMGLRPEVIRLPIFGLGCAGGALGLARAAALARAMPGANVLLVVVELCGLTFRAADRSPANMVATALFGDGAAAALLTADGPGPAVSAWGEHTWPNSLDVMGWDIAEDGFKVLFSRDIPTLVATRLRPAFDLWLGRVGLKAGDVGGYACHPGGAKVVSALEAALELEAGTLKDERLILRDHGNMSAATLLFVLERRLTRPLPRRMAAMALGPGFTAGFLMLEGQ